MCGIVAYRGHAAALPTVLRGLGRLEYRGYDSAGIALATGTGGQLFVRRAVGALSALREMLKADGDVVHTIGVAHTRWTTAGSQDNAHPHGDCTGGVAVVHIGTIDNAAAIRERLRWDGHAVATEVDTEVVAHLIEDALAAQPSGGLDGLVAAVVAAVGRLEGVWALAVVAKGVEGVVLTRHRSPLLVAETDDGLMASSDVVGFSGRVRTVRGLRDGQIVALGDDLRWFDAAGEAVEPPAPLRISAAVRCLDRGPAVIAPQPIAREAAMRLGNDVIRPRAPEEPVTVG